MTDTVGYAVTRAVTMDGEVYWLDDHIELHELVTFHGDIADYEHLFAILGPNDTDTRRTSEMAADLAESNQHTKGDYDDDA